MRNNDDLCGSKRANEGVFRTPEGEPAGTEKKAAYALRRERSSRKLNHLYYTTRRVYMKTIKLIGNILLGATAIAGMAAWVLAEINHNFMVFAGTMGGCVLAGLLLGAAEAIYNAGRRDEYNRRKFHE